MWGCLHGGFEWVLGFVIGCGWCWHVGCGLLISVSGGLFCDCCFGIAWLGF